ncbi:hypothetical protein BpHYR1_000954 [Brachionus plicatilis]|uniref:RanBP2-type domain-containing protein n=1 Tax=Brachionus plicatilis TaxID=10195 RepID=A0A3M7RDD5_BRAPC|nr:hypothetical protein BpHYR1_000954 [Brachionus plicatilis]
MHKKCSKNSLSELRFRPYPTEKPRNHNSTHHYNATLAKLLSLSERSFTLFKSLISGTISDKSGCEQTNKKVQFNITPDFLEPENHEYFKDSYFYYSSSGISSSAKKSSDKIPNSILKPTNTWEQKKRWLCSLCLSYNAQDQEKCFQCKNFKSELDTNYLKARSFAGLPNLDISKRKQPLKLWKCHPCSYANYESDYCCKNCRNSKEDPRNQITERKELSEKKKNFNALFSKNIQENIATSLNQAKKIAKSSAWQSKNLSSGTFYSAKESSKSNSILKTTNTQEQKKRWMCSLCLSYNAQDQEKCFQCKNFKSELDTNFFKTSSSSGLNNLDLNTRKELSIPWKCIECSFVNNNSENFCKNCRSSKTNPGNTIHEIKEPFSLTKYWTEGKKHFNELFSKNNKENIATSLNQAKKIVKPLALQSSTMN